MVCDFASDSVRGEKSQTENLPVMSDSVRGPRRLIGEFDVGLGPWSVVRGLSLVRVRGNRKQPLNMICQIVF